ncbi:MAG: hypothetical protein AAFR65_11180 [Pseudomonadota bacterium]
MTPRLVEKLSPLGSGDIADIALGFLSRTLLVQESPVIESVEVWSISNMKPPRDEVFVDKPAARQ